MEYKVQEYPRLSDEAVERIFHNFLKHLQEDVTNEDITAFLKAQLDQKREELQALKKEVESLESTYNGFKKLDQKGNVFKPKAL